jgi:quercetin dioxygenase-like cupin family protein
MNENEWREKLKEEGFSDISIVSFGPDKPLPEHTHEDLTVQVILEGELTLMDQNGSKTMHRGERFESEAGTTHSAKCGPNGCKFIIGIKK